jgi:hypothetical protein
MRCRGGRSPAGLCRGRLESAREPWLPLEKRQAIRERILAGGVCQLVDHALHRERGMGVADGAPPQHGDRCLRGVQRDVLGLRVFETRRVGNAFDRRRVDAVVDRKLPERRFGGRLWLEAGRRCRATSSPVGGAHGSRERDSRLQLRVTSSRGPRGRARSGPSPTLFSTSRRCRRRTSARRRRRRRSPW